MDGEAGKGDCPRDIDLKKYGATYDRVFGEKDPLFYQRDYPGKGFKNSQQDSV